MTTASKSKRSLPAGWRVINNPSFVSALDLTAGQFADRVEAEYKKLFGLYTRSDKQVVLMEHTPEQDVLTRACAVLFERGLHCTINWISETRLSSLEVKAVAANSKCG